MSKLTYEEAHRVFRFDPETGYLYWRWCGRKRTLEKPVGHAGKSHSNGDGYRRVWYNGRKYLVHRIIWLMNYGEWPEHQIDHDNECKDDNRLSNLDDLTGLQNTGKYFSRRRGSANFR